MIVVVGSGGALFHVNAQESEGMVKYTPDFRFNDGIYLNFEQVKASSPIPKAKILTSTDYNDKDFFKNLMSGEKIYFYDGMGIRQEVDRSSIWGYARNGVLYIQVQGNFNRITFVGNICHFVADVTSYDNRYYNSPYGYYDPYSPIILLTIHHIPTIRPMDMEIITPRTDLIILHTGTIPAGMSLCSTLLILNRGRYSNMTLTIRSSFL